MSDEDFDTKREQFNNLWDSPNRTKKLKFRQYIREHVRQKRVPLTRENCEKYWMGELQKEMLDAETF
mgnify:FL=1|tara:strand:+ start:402 stop:602 length:201 start_codon:yes stop_codon:yes gene_type:complete